MKTILIIVLSMFLLSCSKTDKIIGTWERKGDEFAGLQVKVEQVGDRKFFGKIVKTTDRTKEDGFLKGVLKWKKVVKVNDNMYKLLDQSSDNSYEEQYIEFINDNKLQSNSVVKDGNRIGDYQEWIRIQK